MITGAQIKAARVLLGWSSEEASKPPNRHIASIRDVLEDPGIQFIDSVGVALQPVLPVEIGLKAAPGKEKR